MITPISHQQIDIWRAELQQEQQRERDRKLMVHACIEAILGGAPQVRIEGLEALQKLIHPQVLGWFLRGLLKCQSQN